MTDERTEATDDVQQVVDAVKSTVDEQVAPLMERQSALDEKLEELAQPIARPSPDAAHAHQKCAGPKAASASIASMP